MVSDRFHLGPFDAIKCKNKLGIYECMLQSGNDGEERIGTVVSVESIGSKILVNGKEIFIKNGMLDKSECAVIPGPDGSVLQCNQSTE